LELWRAQVKQNCWISAFGTTRRGVWKLTRCSHAKHHELHWKFCRKFGRWRTEYGWKILTRLVHVTYSPRKATNLIIILWNWKRISFFLWNWKHIYSCDTRRSATPDSDVEDADCWGWRHIGGPMVGCRLRVDLVRKDLMGPVTWANLFLRQCRWTPWAYLIRVTLSSEHWHRLFYNWDS